MNLDLTTTAFSQANAYACALQSEDAYDEAPTISTDLAHVRISELPDAVIVAFRGTKSPRDFFTDAEFRREKSAVFGGSIHGGFLKSFLSISDALTDQLFKLPPKPLFITGHSLGGALAVLCAVWCMKHNIPVRAVYTFGQPRVGDSDWSKAYGPKQNFEPLGSTMGYRTFRLVNEEDIVPRIPSLLAGFRHAGQLCFMPADGKSVLQNPSWVRMLRSDLYGLVSVAMARRCGLGALEEIFADHHISKYVGRLA